MKKIDRILVQLKSNVAYSIILPDRIDCASVELAFRYNALSSDIQLEITFADIDGRRIGENINLPRNGLYNYKLDTNGAERNGIGFIVI